MTPSGTLPTAKLQKIDRWLGVPTCFLLTRLRRLLERATPAVAIRPRNILFIKLAEQGSTVLAAAAIQRAVEMVGRENVYFAVFAENRFILDVLDLIPAENVFAIDASGFGGLAASACKILRTIRRLRFDAAIDLEFFARSSAAFTFLTGAQRRVGFQTFYGEGPYRGDLMTHRLLYNPYLHTSQTFALMVAALTVNPAQLPTFGVQPPEADAAAGASFQPRYAEVAEVQALLLKETGGRSAAAPLILLNANASDLLPLRRWAPERYVALARRLLDEFPDVCVLMTGAPAEADAAERLVAEIGSRRCFSVAGKTSLRQLLVLYTLADLLVTNDSGPAHFASLTPIHVVTLFGPETPRLFAALTSRNVPLWSGVACSPCVNAYNNRQSPCRNNVCMQQITVDEVFTAAAASFRQRLAEADRGHQFAGLAR
jgi:ADP-heptose:LPS heptosyltransferase